jgi:hypothetical protein
MQGMLYLVPILSNRSWGFLSRHFTGQSQYCVLSQSRPRPSSLSTQVWGHRVPLASLKRFSADCRDSGNPTHSPYAGYQPTNPATERIAACRGKDLRIHSAT